MDRRAMITRHVINQSAVVRNPVVAVLVIDRLDAAVPAASALVEGGIRSIELALRTDVAVTAIAAIKKAVPEMTVGAGTVLFPDQVAEVVDAGADFAVAPGCSIPVAQAAIDAGLPFAPGIATPTDIEAALGLGFRALKFYPAEQLGGLDYLVPMTAPYRHLGLSFIPLGGVTFENVERYLACPIVAAVGGSWIATRELLNAAEWSKITENARAAAAVAARVREAAR